MSRVRRSQQGGGGRGERAGRRALGSQSHTDTHPGHSLSLCQPCVKGGLGGRRTGATALPLTCCVPDCCVTSSRDSLCLGLGFLFCKVEVMLPISSILGRRGVKIGMSGSQQLVRHCDFLPQATWKSRVGARRSRSPSGLPGQGRPCPVALTCLPFSASLAFRGGWGAGQGPRETGFISASELKPLHCLAKTQRPG